MTEPTVVNGQVVLLNGRLLSTGGSNAVKVGFAISSEGLLPAMTWDGKSIKLP